MNLDDLLLRHRDDLAAFVARHAGRLLRYESTEDLVQGMHVRALERGSTFRYEGEKPFFAWMYTLARGYLADRHAHWGALRRSPRTLLRLARAGGGSDGVAEPPGDDTGPSTFADRRESLTLAVKALGLPPRPISSLKHLSPFSDDKTHGLEVFGGLPVSWCGWIDQLRNVEDRGFGFAQSCA